MQKMRMFLFAVAVTVMLSVLALGAVAPTIVDVLSEPDRLLCPDPGDSQGGGGGG